MLVESEDEYPIDKIKMYVSAAWISMEHDGYKCITLIEIPNE